MNKVCKLKLRQDNSKPVKKLGRTVTSRFDSIKALFSEKMREKYFRDDRCTLMSSYPLKILRLHASTFATG